MFPRFWTSNVLRDTIFVIDLTKSPLQNFTQLQFFMVIQIFSIMNILLDHMIFYNLGRGYSIIYLKIWDSNSTRHSLPCVQTMNSLYININMQKLSNPILDQENLKDIFFKKKYNQKTQKLQNEPSLFVMFNLLIDIRTTLFDTKIKLVGQAHWAGPVQLGPKGSPKCRLAFYIILWIIKLVYIQCILYAAISIITDKYRI